MAEVATVNSQGSTEVALRARAACETIKVAEPLCQSYNLRSNNIADGCTTRLYPEVVGLQDATILTASCTTVMDTLMSTEFLRQKIKFHIRGGSYCICILGAAAMYSLRLFRRSSHRCPTALKAEFSFRNGIPIAF